MIDTDMITVQKSKSSRIAELDLTNLQFGSVISDHMLVCDYSNGEWGTSKDSAFREHIYVTNHACIALRANNI